ncbi:hypothetical protein, partial [Porphyromonas gingivalis]
KSLEIRYKYTKCKLHEQRKTSLIFRRLNILSRISDKSKCDSPAKKPELNIEIIRNPNFPISA